MSTECLKCRHMVPALLPDLVKVCGHDSFTNPTYYKDVIGRSFFHPATRVIKPEEEVNPIWCPIG